MIRSSSSTLDTARRRPHRTLFPRLPNTQSLSIDPASAEDLTARTLEACRRSGIDSAQILPIDFARHPLFDAKAPQNRNVPEAVLELRRTFAEKERLVLLKQVDFIRRSLLSDNWSTSATPSARAAPRSAKVAKSSPRKVNQSAATPPARTAKNQSAAELAQFARQETARNIKARAKAVKINALISAKWDRESRRVQQQRRLERGDSIIDANRRHQAHVASVLSRTKEQNARVEEKSAKARAAMAHAEAARTSAIRRSMALSDKRLQATARMNAKQQREHQRRERRRFKQHQLAHQRIEHQEAVHSKRRNQTALRKHRLAQRTLTQKQRAAKAKMAEEATRKKDKCVRARVDKARKEEALKREVLANIERVERRMREVEGEKRAHRAELKKQSQSKCDKINIVKRNNEKQRSEFAQRMSVKEREAERRLMLTAKEKQEERLLRQELSRLRKKQRRLQVEREKKRDDYERSRLEKKLAHRDQTLALREQTRRRVIEKQRRYNDKQRLLRAELSYQFLHLSEDTVVSPVAITRFSSKLTGKQPVLPKELRSADGTEENSM